MGYKRYCFLRIILLSCGIVVFSCSSSAMDSQPLPRSLGSIYLNMSIKEFTALTGIEPEPCHECNEGELHAGIHGKEYFPILPSYYQKLEKWQKGVDVLFYLGKLYRIDAFPEIHEVESAIKEYSSNYGKKPEIKNWSNGISWATWEDNETKVSLGYVRERGEGYPLNQKVGTVFLISISDTNILNSFKKDHP